MSSLPKTQLLYTIISLLINFFPYLAFQLFLGAKAHVQRCTKSFLLHINTDKNNLLTTISSLSSEFALYNISLQKKENRDIM